MSDRSRLGRDPLKEVSPAVPPASTPAEENTASLAPPSATLEACPMTTFLRGILESVLPDPGPRLVVSVAPQSVALPAEKLFFFSYALQLLLSPIDLANILGRHHRLAPPAMDASVQALLTPRGQSAFALRLFDDGNFFYRFFPKFSLDMEPFRPLLLFLRRRQGSLVLKQGRSVEFEIICS